MDNLLCDESWLLSCPLTPEPLPNLRRDSDAAMMCPVMSPTTVEEAFSMDLKKESCFSNYGDKFIEFLVSKKLIDSRFQAVQWLIQTRSRLKLSYETLFSAANCFDRFVFVTNCHEWTNWMVELVVLTSLTITSKFNEVTSPSLQEFQMEGLNHMFHHKTVLEMELIVLKALEWRVNSVTSYSFSQILTSKFGVVGDGMLMNRITDHLLDDLCDMKMLEYPPSVVAVSVLKLLEEKAVRDDNLGSIMNLFGQKHKESIVKCMEVMKSRKVDHWWQSKRKSCEVKSLVYMLQRGDIMNLRGDYCFEDLSAIFQIFRSEGSENKKKRDRDSYEDKDHPAKRMTIVMSNQISHL